MYKIQNKDKSIKKKPSKLNTFTTGEKSTMDMSKSLQMIAKAMEMQAEMMKNMQPLLNTMNELKEEINRENTNTISGTNENGDIIITSLDIPPNHLDSSNAFKGKDVDVERFISMCRRQFGYYEKFYVSEKKRVEFIEAHLGTASEWYYTYMCDKQNEHPDSESLLSELKKFHLTDLPDSLKFKRLKELKHKWGNASDFVTKFKLYATQLNIPEIVQLELFEDRVNPLVKKKLQDLEPQRRTIETYSSMLMTYDNERDRHWNFEQPKRKNSFREEDQGKRKKFKSWKNRNFTQKYEDNKNNEKKNFNNNYKYVNYDKNKKSTNDNTDYNYKNNGNSKPQERNDPKNLK